MVSKGAKKVKGQNKAKKGNSGAVSTAQEKGGISTPARELSNKDYERELRKLHVELVKLQQWVVAKGLKVCIVFEGRDGAGRAAPSRRSRSA